MERRVLLVVLDGWGLAPAGKGNAISLAKTPNFDMLWSKYPHTKLLASGEAVGLPKGQMGNSEVGHLNIGAGRVVMQDLPRITNSIKDSSFFENIELKKAFLQAKKRGKKVHLIGQVSPGGVHSHQDHLYALLEMAKDEGAENVFVHAITDGRDTEPQSADIYITQLENMIKKIGLGKIATISGRYYAMDRDNRWDRIAKAYSAMVLGQGELAKNAVSAIENSYKKSITDEFIRPTIIEQDGLISDEDTVIFFNLRSDRPRELVKALVLDKFSNFKRQKTLKNLYFVTMTEYEADLPVSGVAFPPENIKNTLSEVISDHGYKQFHIAETEKYPHVTFFFNGGREEPFSGETRLVIPSPLVPTYDKKPEMSAEAISTKLMDKIGYYKFIIVNYANCDLVGHTGDTKATIRGVETVDACLGGVVIAARNLGYDVCILADHGNAEKMLNDDGTPCTSHTTNPVPFIIVSNHIDGLKHVSEAKLSDVAPTVLELLKIEKPKEMTGRSLIL